MPDPTEQLLKYWPDAVDVDNTAGVGLEREIVDPDGFVVPVGHLEGVLTNYPKAEVIEYRHHIRQGQRLIWIEEFEMQRAFILLQGPVEAHGQIVIVGRCRNVVQIDGRPPGREHVGITGRESTRPKPVQLITLFFAISLAQGFGKSVAPGLRKLNNLLANLGCGQLAVFNLGDPDGELDPRQYRLGKVRYELHVLGFQPVYQHLLYLESQLGVVDVPWEERQAGNKLAVHILPHEQLDPAALLDIQNAFRHLE